MSKSNVVVLPTTYAAGEAPPAEHVHPWVTNALEEATEAAAERKACGVFIVLVTPDGCIWTKSTTAGLSLTLEGAVQRAVRRMDAEIDG